MSWWAESQSVSQPIAELCYMPINFHELNLKIMWLLKDKQTHELSEYSMQTYILIV